MKRERERKRSKGAPVPVARYTGSHLGGQGQIGLESSAARFLTGVKVGGFTRVLAILSLVDGVLNLAQAISSGFLPALVGTPAEIAGAGGNTLGVEARILVEWHDVGSMGGAEDMTAVTAMVTAQEETKGRATSGRITIGGG